MPRRPTITCTECGKPMWVGTGALPQGQARCLACRRANPIHTRTYDARKPCLDCGVPSYGERCHPCQSARRTVRAEDDHRVVRNHRERLAPGIRWADRKRLLDKWKRQGRRCSYCCSRMADTIDHIIPLVRGGTNYEGNLVPACRPCNSSKGARTVTEWRAGRSARRMAKAPGWKRKADPIKAIRGGQSAFQVCVCGLAHIGRGPYCSERCRARTAYRMKVGIPLDAAPYEVRASA